MKKMQHNVKGCGMASFIMDLNSKNSRNSRDEEEEEEGGWVLVGRPPAAREWECSRCGRNGGSDSSDLSVVFKGPAMHWTDALPIGNGRLGAMVWGGVSSETLQLNDDTLWTGVPGDYTDPHATSVLSQVRELVDNGQYAEATAAAFKLSGQPSDVYQLLGDIKLDFGDSHGAYESYARELDLDIATVKVYQPLGDIKLDFGDSYGAYESYTRELNLDTATVKVKYTTGEVEFMREHFSSNPHQVIVTKISTNKSGSLSFTVSLDSKLHHHSYVTGKNRIVMEGSCPGRRKPPKGNAGDNPEGIQFSAVLDLQMNGNAGKIQILDGTKLRVEASDYVVLLLAASSSFGGPFTNPSDSRKVPTSASIETLNSIGKMSYSELYAHHLDDYQKLFRRVSIGLSKSSKHVYGKDGMTFTEGINANVIQTTADRVKSFNDDEDPSLVALLFHYGRYLLISCSRPGTQVANLQGIWSKDIEPAWDAAQHLNINLQMNYWPSLPCNISECQQPLFDYISSLATNGSKTARVNYDSGGWVVHQVSDIWAKTSPDRGDPVWALWPMGGAWLCTHLWEHYTFSMDMDFLENKAYPLLEGCISFLLDWLVEGHDGYLETNPSTSPEHSFIAPDGKTASVSYSSTMDMSIIREVFSAFIYASELLRRKNDTVEEVRKAQLKLYPTKISRDGSIMEWAQDFEDPDVHHRHLSHLFGLFPGHTISLEKTPDLCRAAAYSLYKRGEDGPGWSTTWKMALWARLHNSEHAYRMVKKLINLVDPDHEGDFEGGLYSNLFTAHPPFQIDANFGFTAAVAEMLVQSTENDLFLLPALPRDKWLSGCVSGLMARGGVTVSICWNEGELHEAVINNNNNGLQVRTRARKLHYKQSTASVRLSTGCIYTFNKELKCVKKLRSHCA